jgi:hypothetical protein
VLKEISFIHLGLWYIFETGKFTTGLLINVFSHENHVSKESPLSAANSLSGNVLI